MSNSLEFTPIPAFELSKALYFPEEAKKCYKSMTILEQETVASITSLIQKRLDARLSHDSSDTTVSAIVIDNGVFSSDNKFELTPNVAKYFEALGYTVQLIPSGPFPSISEPVLIIRWL